MSFEVLPLIEFKPSKEISHGKIIELINSDKKDTKQNANVKRNSKNVQNDGWNQSVGANQQVLSFNG
jgi:hypothetical protein